MTLRGLGGEGVWELGSYGWKLKIMYWETYETSHPPEDTHWDPKRFHRKFGRASPQNWGSSSGTDRQRERDRQTVLLYYIDTYSLIKRLSMHSNLFHVCLDPVVECCHLFVYRSFAWEGTWRKDLQKAIESMADKGQQPRLQLLICGQVKFVTENGVS